jgi:hypothetical protein
MQTFFSNNSFPSYFHYLLAIVCAKLSYVQISAECVFSQVVCGKAWTPDSLKYNSAVQSEALVRHFRFSYQHYIALVTKKSQYKPMELHIVFFSDFISILLAKLSFNGTMNMVGRSQWLHALRCGSAAARLLGMRVRIPTWAWMYEYVSCECCVLSS